MLLSDILSLREHILLQLCADGYLSPMFHRPEHYPASMVLSDFFKTKGKCWIPCRSIGLMVTERVWVLQVAKKEPSSKCFATVCKNGTAYLSIAQFAENVTKRACWRT